MKFSIIRVALFIALSGVTLMHEAFAQQAATSPSAASSAAQAQQVPPSPIPLMQTLSNQMISALKANQASMQKDPHVVYQIVKQILLPSADLESMARSALGRDAWLSATPTQQQAFIGAFTNLMIHTYAAGLSSYTDQTVQFSPIRGGMQAGQNRVEVNSQIIRTDGPPISVSYRLIYKQQKDGTYAWLVYDFSVEGISMIQSFRSQFSAELSNGMNIDALTTRLNVHNAEANNGNTKSS